MLERTKEIAASVPKNGLRIWNEYVFPVLTTVIYARPLHFAVTRFVSGIKEGDRVLELGSGYPWYEIYASKTGNEGTFVALDHSHSIQRKSKGISKVIDKSLRKREKSTVNQVTGETDQLPFVDNSFDKVLVSNSRIEMDEIYRVLKPGGRVLMAMTEPTVPVINGMNFFNLKDSNLENVKIFPGAPALIPALIFPKFHYLGILGIYNWYLSARKPVEEQVK